MNRIPEIPFIGEAFDSKGINRFWVIANNPGDVEFILSAAGIYHGIPEHQDNDKLCGWYRKLSKAEFERVRKVFPP